MRKKLLWQTCFLILLFGGQAVLAATKHIPDERQAEQEMFSLLDMKIFHDRPVMQQVVLKLYDQQMSGNAGRDNFTEGILSEKDSRIFERTMDNKQIKYQLTPELLKKANQAPFEAFKDLIRTAEVPEISSDEMEELEQIDKKAISQLLQMGTESGPDIGAKPVSVIYDDETQN